MYDRNKFSFTVITTFAFLFVIVCFGVTSSYSLSEDDIDSWNVKFTDSTVINNGASLYDEGRINENATTVENINFEFDNTQDSITYKISVANTGDINAEIASIIVTDPKCSNEDFCNNLVYSLNYEDGTEVKRGDKLDSKTGTDLYLTISSTAEYLDAPVTVEGINLSVGYTESVSE